MLNPPAVAAWFDARLQAFDVFLAQGGPQQAGLLCAQVVRSTAHRLALTAQLDSRGESFPWLVALLASSCRMLAVWPSIPDWQRAVSDGGGAQAGSLIAGALDIDLTSQFKEWATHAFIAAGVVPGIESDAPEEERRGMHELAVAHTMRLLVAYAANCQLPLEPLMVQFRQALFAP